MSPKDAMKTKYFRKTGRVGGGGEGRSLGQKTVNVSCLFALLIYLTSYCIFVRPYLCRCSY